jgi:hypothetical protein
VQHRHVAQMAPLLQVTHAWHICLHCCSVHFRHRFPMDATQCWHFPPFQLQYCHLHPLLVLAKTTAPPSPLTRTLILPRPPFPHLRHFLHPPRSVVWVWKVNQQRKRCCCFVTGSDPLHRNYWQGLALFTSSSPNPYIHTRLLPPRCPSPLPLECAPSLPTQAGPWLGFRR